MRVLIVQHTHKETKSRQREIRVTSSAGLSRDHDGSLPPTDSAIISGGTHKTPVGAAQ